MDNYQRVKMWRLNNPEKAKKIARESSKRRYKEKRDVILKQNIEYTRLMKLVVNRSFFTSISDIKKAVFDRDNGKCVVCGANHPVFINLDIEFKPTFETSVMMCRSCMDKYKRKVDNKKPLTFNQRQEMYRLYKEGVKISELSRKYNLSRQRISIIIKKYDQ